MWSKYLILGLQTSPTRWDDERFRYTVEGENAELRWAGYEDELGDGLVKGMLVLATEEPVEHHQALGHAHGVEALFCLVPFCSHHVLADLALLPLPDNVDVDGPFTFEHVGGAHQGFLSR